MCVCICSNYSALTTSCLILFYAPVYRVACENVFTQLLQSYDLLTAISPQFACVRRSAIRSRRVSCPAMAHSCRTLCCDTNVMTDMN